MLYLLMSSLRVMEETENQQHVIATENSLFKEFIIEGVRNYDQK